MTAKASKPARVGHGLRARLLLSFIAISGFAVVAAVVGNYAFYAIGEALHQVTEKSVPPPSRPWSWRSVPSALLPPAPHCLA